MRQRKCKYIFSVMMLLIILLGMASCGKASDSKEGEGAKPAGSTDSTTRIGIVLDVGGLQDGSINQLAWEGASRAVEELGVTAEYKESESEADYARNIKEFLEEDCDLIIAAGYMLADAVRTAAVANPHQRFAIIDDDSCGELENVSCLIFDHEQSAYLVGLVAGTMTKTDIVGIVIGKAAKNINRYGYGYCAGVKDANPNAQILQMNANSYSDAQIGSVDASYMINDGADVIFHVAGGVGKGVIETCQERGAYAIGVDVDQSSLAPETVLTSAMKRVDTAIYQVIEQMEDGKFQNGETSFGLAEEGVSIAPTKDLLSGELQRMLEEKKQKIIQGEIVVPADQETFEASYGDIYEMD